MEERHRFEEKHNELCGKKALQLATISWSGNLGGPTAGEIVQWRMFIEACSLDWIFCQLLPKHFSVVSQHKEQLEGLALNNCKGIHIAFPCPKNKNKTTP